MCFKSNNQITKTLTITKLAEHHRKQLVPTGEVLHVAIAIILANIVVKLSPVQKVNYIWLQSYKIKSVSFQKPA